MECQEAFEKFKWMLTSDLFLTHYDFKKEIIVASVASSYGIGACIMHKLKDGYCTRIQDAEKNYSMKEKESLEIAFVLKKFHSFLHARRFTLKTDHKPLVAIFGFKKPTDPYR